MSCTAKHLLYLVLCVQPLLSFATSDVLLSKTSYIWRLFCNTSFICLFPCAELQIAMHLFYLALVLNCVFCLAHSMCAAVQHLNVLLLTFVLYIVLSAVRCVHSSSLVLLHA